MTLLTDRSSSNLTVALDCAARSWPGLPLCWPEDGRCGCLSAWDKQHGIYVPHTGHDIGKAPINKLVGHGVDDATTDPDLIESWWEQYPNANVGIDIGRAGLLVVDPDSAEAKDEALRNGLPPTLVRKSRHDAYVYRSPVGCPKVNVIDGGRSKEVDILVRGYIVAHGQHQTGCDVFLEWIADPQPAPQWAVNMVYLQARQRAEQAARAKARREAEEGGEEPPVCLSERAMQRWRGEQVERRADGQLDRSNSLFYLGLDLAQANATRRTIVTALCERDVSLGWEKFSRRSDADARYGEIADKALDYVRGDYPSLVGQPFPKTRANPSYNISVRMASP